MTQKEDITMEAMDKVRDEMAQSHAPGIEAVGEGVTRLLLRNPEHGAAILAEGKTLKGAFESLKAWAKANQKNGCCFVGPEQASKLVAEYYGIPAEDLLAAIAGADMPKEKTQAPAQAARRSVAAALDLDALMGGI